MDDIENKTRRNTNLKIMTDDEKREHLRKLKQARDRRRYIKNKYIKEQEKKNTIKDTEQDTEQDTRHRHRNRHRRIKRYRHRKRHI